MDNESLSHPRISRIIGILFLFCAVFIASLWLGQRLGNTTRLVALAAFPALSENNEFSEKTIKQINSSVLDQETSLLSEKSLNGDSFDRQRNLLLIGIDNFQAQEPRLEAVWLIIYLRDQPHFMLMPIYPDGLPGANSGASMDQNLANRFKLEGGQKPSINFLQSLQDKHLWWNGYLILDRSGLSEIITLITGDDDIKRHNLLSSVSNLPETQEAPLRALMGQAQLLEELCQNSGALLESNTAQLPSLIAKVSANIQTDLNLGEVAGEIISALRKGDGISCELPAMTITTNLP
jgi:hypothetical protein